MCCASPFLKSRLQQLRGEWFYTVVVIAVKFAQTLIDSRRSLVLHPQKSAFFSWVNIFNTRRLKLLSQLFATCLFCVLFLILAACKTCISIYVVAVHGAAKTNWIYAPDDIRADKCLAYSLWRSSGATGSSLAVNKLSVGAFTPELFCCLALSKYCGDP